MALWLNSSISPLLNGLIGECQVIQLLNNSMAKWLNMGLLGNSVFGGVMLKG